jgi:hypothetical protein
MPPRPDPVLRPSNLSQPYKPTRKEDVKWVEVAADDPIMSTLPKDLYYGPKRDAVPSENLWYKTDDPLFSALVRSQLDTNCFLGLSAQLMLHSHKQLAK